jgi:cytochrome c oxidase subunit 4
MADETNKPLEQQPAQPTPIDPENPPEAIAEQQTMWIREQRAQRVPDAQVPDAAGEFRERETPEQEAARRQFEKTLDKPIEAIEDAVNRLDAETRPVTPEQVLAAHHGDKTVVFGRTFDMPIYTFVFFVLAAVTVVEVIIAELPEGFLGTALLVGLSAAKAVLVVLFYMHLREDSRIFALALIIPLIIAAIAALFLLAVPTTGYSY